MYSNEEKSPVRYPKTPAALLSKSSPRVFEQDEEGNLPKRKSLSFEDQSDSQHDAPASLKEDEPEDVEMTDAPPVEESGTASPVVSPPNQEKLTGVEHVAEGENAQIKKNALTQCDKEKLSFAEESSLDGFLMQLDTDGIPLTTPVTVDICNNLSQMNEQKILSASYVFKLLH